MGWNWLFGSPEDQQALQSEDYTKPIWGRMRLARQLGGAAQAVAEAGRRGGGIGPMIAAVAGGMGAGSDEFSKSRHLASSSAIEAIKAKYDPLGVAGKKALTGGSEDLTPVGPGAGKPSPTATVTPPVAPGTAPPPGAAPPGAPTGPAAVAGPVIAQKIADARAAIARGAPRAAVEEALRRQGIDPTGKL